MTAAMGRPFLVSLWLNSVGDRNRLVCFSPFAYSLKFIVIDAQGHHLDQTAPSAKYGRIMRGNRCDLETDKQWGYSIPINQFVRIRTAGKYAVKAVLEVDTNYPTVHKLQLESNAIELEVTGTGTYTY